MIVLSIKTGHKLIVLGNDYGGLQGIALMKSEDVAKMFEYMSEIENMTKAGEKGIEILKKEGLKKMQALKERGIGNLKKDAKITWLKLAVRWWPKEKTKKAVPGLLE